MQLYFTGIGGAFAPDFMNNGAFFKMGKDLYLLDCGETLFARLIPTRLLDERSGDLTVILTHTHADHCGSLGTLCLYMAEIKGRPLTLVHPDEGVRSLLSAMGVGPSQYTLADGLAKGSLRITARPIQHAPALPAFAYLLSDGEETIYYSGDTCELPADILCGLREGTIKRAYQDACDFGDHTPPQPVHLPLSTLCDLVEPDLRPKFTLMHLNRDYREKAARLGFSCAQTDRYFDLR